MARSRLPLFVCSLVLAFLLRATCGQYRGLVLDLQVVGGDDTKGYIEATVLLRNGSAVTGPICGTVNSITATFACYNKDLLSSNAQGTVDSIGGISQPTSAPVLSNLACNSYFRSNDQVSYGCTFSTAASCAPGDSVAVGCNLTGGELAAIIIVCIIVFVVVLVGGILLCIFCCCSKQTVCYQTMGARRARQRTGAVLMTIIPPASSLEAREQPFQSEPEPPEYKEAIAEEPDSSPPPPYED